MLKRERKNAVRKEGTMLEVLQNFSACEHRRTVNTHPLNFTVEKIIKSVQMDRTTLLDTVFFFLFLICKGQGSSVCLLCVGGVEHTAVGA